MPKIEILQETLHATHLLKLLGKMYKYEMDPTRTVGATERTCGAGRTRDRGGTDGRTDRRTDEVKPIYPPTTSLCRGYNKRGKLCYLFQLPRQPGSCMPCPCRGELPAGHGCGGQFNPLTARCHRIKVLMYLTKYTRFNNFAFTMLCMLAAFFFLGGGGGERERKILDEWWGFWLRVYSATHRIWQPSWMWFTLTTVR